MSKVLGTRLFGVNYRKTLSSETAFPAPILDALAGYLYLTQKLRFPSSSIILLGDSSGAHLGLCLSQHLHDLRIAQPGYILLTSPLGDVRRAMPSRAEFAGVDILAETMDAKPLHSAMRHYTDGAKDQPAFSPARSRKGDWTFLREEQVKVYIMVGTKEILRDDGLAIVEAMKRDGVDVTLREVSQLWAIA
jgi:acetyl esterase/lipase